MEEYHRLCKKVDENVAVETEEKGLRFQAFFEPFLAFLAFELRLVWKS